MTTMKNHACARAAERYGADLDGADMARMSAMIRRGEATIERTNRDGTQRAIVIYQGKAYFCIYAPERHRIVTVLPHGWTDKRAKAPSKRDHHRMLRRQA